LFRKIAAAIILVPLAIIIIAFAVANREAVTVSLDPFSSDQPAAAVTLPLFAVVLILLILGVLIGGVAAWLRQVKWRRSTRRLQREVAALRAELDSFKRAAGAAAADGRLPEPTGSPTRLKLTPPVR